MKKYYFSLAVVALCFAGSAKAGELSYPKQVFDAVYDIKSTAGGKDYNTNLRMASDGKGHVLNVSTTNNVTSTSISDYPNKVNITLISANKMMMKSPMKVDEQAVRDADSAKKAGGKDLGAKKIDGHSCHGFETTKEGTTVQTWIGDDTKYLVHCDTTSPKTKTAMALKSWSTNPPPANAFNIPAGYKEFTMPH